MQQDPDAPTEESLSETESDELEQASDDTLAEKPVQSRVAPSVRPGPFRTVWRSFVGFFAGIKLPVWNFRLFAWSLLALIIIVFFIGNWSPMRLYFFGFHIQFPKTVAVLVLLAGGFLAGWLAATRRQERDE
jgi:uncharacterized integral membrane protein